jgi:thiol-disulfide isomerase/thioredoxin
VTTGRRAAIVLAAAALPLAGAWFARRPVAMQGEVPAAFVPAHWPDLDLRDLADQPLRLPAASPRVRIVNVWARWCAPCRRELPSLQRMAALLDATRFEVLALALDDDAFALREFVSDQRLTLTVLRHAPATGVPLPGTETLPQTFAVAPDGRVLARWSGAREWDAPAQLQRVREAAREEPRA